MPIVIASQSNCRKKWSITRILLVFFPENFMAIDWSCLKHLSSLLKVKGSPKVWQAEDDEK